MDEKITKSEIRQLRIIRKILERYDYLMSAKILGKIIEKIERA